MGQSVATLGAWMALPFSGHPSGSGFSGHSSGSGWPTGHTRGLLATRHSVAIFEVLGGSMATHIAPWLLSGLLV